MSNFVTQNEEMQRRQAKRAAKSKSGKPKAFISLSDLQGLSNKNQKHLQSLIKLKDAGLCVKEMPEQLVDRLYKKYEALLADHLKQRMKGLEDNSGRLVLGRIKKRIAIVCANRNLVFPFFKRQFTAREKLEFENMELDPNGSEKVRAQKPTSQDLSQ